MVPAIVAQIVVSLAALVLDWYAKEREKGRLVEVEDALQKSERVALALDYLLRARAMPAGNWQLRVRPGAPSVTLDADAGQPPPPDAGSGPA